MVLLSRLNRSNLQVSVDRAGFPLQPGGVDTASVPPPLITAAHEREFFTLAHRVLDLEAQVSPVPDDCYEILDTILRAAAKDIAVTDSSNETQALKALQTIERILQEHNFVCSIPIFLVNTLTEGLTAQPIVPAVIGMPENAGRRTHIEAHLAEPFFHADCDIFSLLYLSIGELLRLPIRMVEAPKHNYIRWDLDDFTYVNWETNFGRSVFSDEDYQHCEHLHATTFLVPLEAIISGSYLRSMRNTEALGYFVSLRGGAYAERGAHALALEDAENAILFFPHSPTVCNNTAWAYVSIPGAQHRKRELDALRLALRAVRAFRDPNLLDTLAAAHAVNRDFTNAFKVETEAFALSGNRDYELMAKIYTLRKTYLQHQLEMQQVLEIISAAGTAGIEHEVLLSQVAFPAEELLLILEGLLRASRIIRQESEGKLIFRAT